VEVKAVLKQLQKSEDLSVCSEARMLLLVSAPLVKSCCAYDMEIFGNQEGERLPLETGTRGLVKGNRLRTPVHV
jgi:hypothetical protein